MAIFVLLKLINLLLDVRRMRDPLKCICNEKLKKFFFEIWKEVGSIDLEKTFFVSKTALKVSKIP